MKEKNETQKKSDDLLWDDTCLRYKDLDISQPSMCVLSLWSHIWVFDVTSVICRRLKCKPLTEMVQMNTEVLLKLEERAEF